jgi:hypothetical protein
MFRTLLQNKKKVIGILLPLIVLAMVIGPFPLGVKEASAHCIPALAFIPGVSSIAGSFRILDCAKPLVYLVFTFFSWVLWAAGAMLNFVIYVTIVQFSTIIKEVAAIKTAWIIIRDLVNMAFIFVLIYIGIRTIIAAGNFQTKKLIINLVLAALFINFSLFITQTIIDASNIVSINFYRSIAPGTDADVVNWTDGGLSHEIVQSLKLASIPRAGQAGATLTSGTFDNLGNSQVQITSMIASSVFIMITAVIFFAATFMFVRRFIVLIFLMVFSPLGFIGFVLPSVSGKKFWDKLIEEATYAPIFFIIMWIAIKIIRSGGVNAITKADQSADLVAAFGGNMANFGALTLNFIIVIGFLIAAIHQAKKQGGVTSDAMTKLGGKVVFGTTGFLGRQSFGRIANRVAESDLGKRMQTGGVFSRAAIAPIVGTAKSGFDFRNTVAGKTLGKYVGDQGQGNKGGFKDYYDKESKRQSDHIEELSRDRVEEDKIDAEKQNIRVLQMRLAEEEASGASAAVKAKTRLEITEKQSSVGRMQKNYDRKKTERQSIAAAQLRAKWAKWHSKSKGLIGVTALKAAEDTAAKYKPTTDDVFEAKVDSNIQNVKQTDPTGKTIATDVALAEDAIKTKLKNTKEKSAFIIKGFKEPKTNTHEGAVVEKLVTEHLSVGVISALRNNNELTDEQEKFIGHLLWEIDAGRVASPNKDAIQKYLKGEAGAQWPI